MKINTKIVVIFLIVTIIQNSMAQDNKAEFPMEKQTSLGLYVTSKEAYDMWKANPEKVKILDVRTAEEYLYVGHAPMAWNIPIFFQSYEWDAAKNKLPMKPNPDFIAKIKQTLNPKDTILISCRSGGRSAMAVNQLAEAGYKNVYNITDGFEGDVVKDKSSVYYEKRMVNGWKNSGAPWTYEINPDLIVTPNKK